MKNIKKSLFLFAVIALLFSVMSCSDGSSSTEPQIRVFADSGVSVYFCLGHINEAENSYTRVSDWLHASNGSFSNYTTIEPGSYDVIFDWDSNHDSARVIEGPYLVEEKNKYTGAFDSEMFYFIKEE